MIIDQEWGLSANENPLQGAYIIDELTDLVEAAVLAEFDRLTERGGVLGAMETSYQRGKIQDESLLYEHRKHDGSLPLIGVNTFRNPNDESGQQTRVELARATEAEKQITTRPPRQIPPAPPRRQRPRPGPATRGCRRQRQHIRCAHGGRPQLLARTDNAGAFRSRWAVPAQRVTTEPT